MKVKKVPMRRCVGCMESRPKRELIRITGYEGLISVDPSGKAKGRGVYVCPSEDCFSRAFKRKAISRGLGAELTGERMAELLDELKKYAERLTGHYDLKEGGV